jgi:hypothetical protein
MEIYGSCEQGCREERLDLVGADSFDELAAESARSRAAVGEFRPIAEALAQREPPGDGWETTYRRLQRAARDALRLHPEAEREPEADEPACQVTAWSCPRCGGLEAPEPCLGICVWRPVEWVSRPAWQDEKDRVRVEHQTEAALRRLLRQVAFITPRADQWERGWQPLNSAARETLAAATRPVVGAYLSRARSRRALRVTQAGALTEAT